MQREFLFISFKLGLSGILLMCLSLAFSFIPSAPIIPGTVVVLSLFQFLFPGFVLTNLILSVHLNVMIY